MICGKSNNNFKPTEIIIDFEDAMIEALKEVLPETKIIGCMFHYTQAIIRNVQKNGLKTTYDGNPLLRSLVRRLIALAFLPEDKVFVACQTIVNSIIENNLFTNEMKSFLEYFTATWINDGAKFPISLWNQYKRTTRTDAVAEGWNSAYNREFHSTHPNIFKVITTLKSDEQMNRINYNHYLETGELPKYKDSKYLKINQKIEETYTNLESGLIDEQRFLHLVQFYLSN
jgi:hypothetical protein